MIDIPLIICFVSGLFYGGVWILNKDMIWYTPRENYISYEAWFAVNNPKGLWYAPLMVALFWPHNYHKVSLDPVSDFLWLRLFVTAAAVFAGMMVGKWLKEELLGQ